MGFLDYDTRTRLVKKYRTQFASGPSTVVAVLAGVSPHHNLQFAERQIISRYLVLLGCYLHDLQSPFENLKTRMQS